MLKFTRSRRVMLISESGPIATRVQFFVIHAMFYEAEQQIVEMIAAGRKITEEAIERYKPVTIFGGFSGGDDSIVATHFAVAEFGAAVAHCNTLTGMDTNRRHVGAVVDRFGWHLIEKHAVALGPPKKQKTDELQLTLFGDEPTWQPACVGCSRRQIAETR